MSQNQMIFFIAGILIAICLFFAIIKRPVHSLFLMVRGAFFILLLYSIQLIGLHFGWQHIVTVNIITALISGCLGVPGIIVLYAISYIL